MPKKYVEKVGEDGFKKAPIGAGPYRFVSFTPGVELALEAFDGYWRKPPAVKRLVMRVIPDPSTRLVALKRGEVDIVFSMIGELAEEVRRTPGLGLKPVYPSTHWLSFPDQWEAKSPWHDRRVRQAANLAIDRPAIDAARTGRALADHRQHRGRARASSSGRRRRRSSIRRGPSGCWPRPATPTASTPASTSATRPPSTPPRS